jgi:metal-responsive CopG/Arc/MetJ family transcriptional regulator
MMINIYRKILIAFDRDLRKQVNREARLQKLDRSKFVRKALAAYIVSEEFRRAEGLTDEEE